MVSERTFISIPLNGAEALMNQSISAFCCDFVKVDGWNSLLIHFPASALTANTGELESYNNKTPPKTDFILLMLHLSLKIKTLKDSKFSCLKNLKLNFLFFTEHVHCR